MNGAIGIETWGGGSKRIRAKKTKLMLITEISKKQKVKSLDLYPLSLKELKSILTHANNGTSIDVTEIPLGSFKLPLINILSPVFEEVALSKLTLSALRELIGAFNK